MDLRSIEAEAVDAERNDYDDRTANQSEVVRMSSLSSGEKQIVAQYTPMIELALLARNFARARQLVTNVERIMVEPDDPFDKLRDEITAIGGLRSAQIGILHAHGFYYLHQFDGRSQRDLSELKHVGKRTVETIAKYMRDAGFPMPRKLKKATPPPAKYTKPPARI